MLVLSRKSGQTIEIDGNIRVDVIRIEGNRVRIGVTAPSDVRILRGELLSSHEFSNHEFSAELAPPVFQDSICGHPTLEAC